MSDFNLFTQFFFFVRRKVYLIASRFRMPFSSPKYLAFAELICKVVLIGLFQKCGKNEPLLCGKPYNILNLNSKS